MKRTGNNKTAVVGWGRGMGHKGHMLLASAVIHQAKQMNATPIFILSKTSLIDPSTGELWADVKKVRATKDDPLSPQEKLAIYQKTFPENAKIFTVADEKAGTINDALARLAQQGYTNIVLVVGEDQKNAFQYLINPSKDGSIPYQNMGLQNLKVMSRQETGAPGSDIAGPRATPMREVLLRPNDYRNQHPEYAKLSDEQMQYAVWRDGMPDSLSGKEVLNLMNTAKDRLTRAEKIAPPRATKLKEFIQRVRPMLKEASVEQKIKILKLIKEATQQGVAEGDVVPFRRPAQQLTWKQLPKDVLLLANEWYWASEDDSGLAAVLDPKGIGSGTRNAMQYAAAKLQQKGWSIDHNDEYDKPGEYNLRLTNKRGQTVLLPLEDAQEFKGWAAGTNDLNEDPYEYRAPGASASQTRSVMKKMGTAANNFIWKKPNQIGGSFTEQELLSQGFKKSQYNSWGGTQAMWNRLLGIKEDYLDEK